jgi:hypothetical protein
MNYGYCGECEAATCTNLIRHQKYRKAVFSIKTHDATKGIIDALIAAYADKRKNNASRISLNTVNGNMGLKFHAYSPGILSAKVAWYIAIVIWNNRP